MNWKPIFCAPGYEVSDCGQVRNTIKGNILKPWKHKSGHLYIACGKAGRFQVHHLVIGAFGAPRPAGLDCRHLDDNPENNTVGNLAWGTRRQNIADRLRLKRKFARSSVTIDVEDQIREALKSYPRRGGREEIARRFGTTLHVVNHIASRKNAALAFKEAA